MKRSFIILIAIVALVLGCAKGKDGEDGDAYAYLLGTSGVYYVDLSEVGITDSTIYYNTRYKMTPGPAQIWWCVGSSPSCTWGYLDVDVEIEEGKKGKDAALPLVGKAEEGDDGQDHLYYVEIISTTLYWDDEWVDHGDAPATLAMMSTNGVVGDTELAIPNISRVE